MRLGGVETIKVDVRIIAATNVDLQQMMEEGRFREDLYYRLHVITVQLPPLRERKDDIPLLVQHFLEKYGEENHKPRPRADARGARPADGLRLAGQRARARERHRARRRAVDRAAHRRRPRPRSRAQHAGASRCRSSWCRPRASRSRTSITDFEKRPDRVDARGGRRRAEARRRAAPHQADDAERDDQAATTSGRAGSARAMPADAPAPSPTPPSLTIGRRRTSCRLRTCGQTEATAPTSASGLVSVGVCSLRDHPLVLAQDHVPPVVLAHVVAPVAAHARRAGARRRPAASGTRTNSSRSA